MNSYPFFIATSQRSGAHFLMTLLNSTKKAGYLQEHLHHLRPNRNEPLASDSEILEMFDKIPRQDTPEFWGSKVDICELIIAERYLELIDADPKSIKWIWLRRRNKVRQGISYIKAATTEIWHLNVDDPPEKKEKARADIDVSLRDLYNMTTLFYIADEAWQVFFNKHGITPHAIYYEDFIDESTWLTTIENIFDFLGVPYESTFEVATTRLKQASGDVPASYLSIADYAEAYGIPLKYTPLETKTCYELDLETLKKTKELKL